MALSDAIKDACHTPSDLKQRLLGRRGQSVLFCPDPFLDPVIEIREEELHRHPEDDAEAEGTDQCRQPFPSLELPKDRGSTVAEQLGNVRS